MTRYTYSVAHTSARPNTQRAIVVLLLVTGVTLLALAHSGNGAVGAMRARMMGILQPALSAISRPVTSVREMVGDVHDLFNTFDENRKLKAENDALRHWQAAALALKAENDSLRALAAYQPVQQVSYATARVISTSAGVFGHSLLIDVGSDDGILDLQPVIDAHGLIGRVTEVNRHSARVLLLSDVLSRVPVVTGTSRQRAILAGTGGDLLRLSFLSADSSIALGEQVTTTEEGGLIPGGIAIGTVFRHDNSGYLVQPARSLTSPEYVRVVQFTNGVPAASPTH